MSRVSNYFFGRKVETLVGRMLKQRLGGCSFKLSPGSKGPSDVTIYKDGVPKYDVQVKASRATTISNNKCPLIQKINLVNYANRKGTVPLIVETKGRNAKVTNPITGQTYKTKI